MSNTTTPAIPQPKSSMEVFKGILNAPSVQEQFRNALKDSSSLFVASMIDLYGGDAAIQTCDPKAVVMEALKAAVLNLPINKALGYAYIVVYKNSVLKDGAWIKVPTPTFVIGYKGYYQMAMRTGQYRTLNADLVYEGELRKVNKLTGEIQFDGIQTSDKVIGYFCYFELMNGFSKTLYMTVEKMAKHAKRFAKSIKATTTVAQLEAMANTEVANYKVGWEGGGFNDMGIKTVTRNLLSHYGYLSTEMRTAISDDNDTDSSESHSNQIEAQSSSKTLNITEIQFDPVTTPISGEAVTTESDPY